MRFLLILALLALPLSAQAVEIDFAKKITDLEGKAYRDCVRPNSTKQDCDEWIDHTLGLIAFSALDRPTEQAPSGAVTTGALIEQARRGSLARRVYSGKSEIHLVELSSSEITMIVDAVFKMNLRAVELLSIVEMLDPTRLKDLSK